MRPIRQHIEAAAELIAPLVPPTLQYPWPLLQQHLGCEVWVKHENHTPTGAFKVRGGIVYFDYLATAGIAKTGVVSATRGNHGQSIGFAARRHNIPATICVPYGNSVEKNAAMQALGVALIEHGEDFQQAREYAETLARDRGLHMVPAFHPLLVAGVATYSCEWLRAVTGLEVVYIPIGLGSGICGMVAARAALQVKTKIVGVVSAAAPAYARSFKARQVVEAPVSTSVADGMACRVPEPEALEMIWKNVDDIVEVTDDEIVAAIRLCFAATHNCAEGAGAAGLAGIMKHRDALQGRRVGFVLSGANIDHQRLAAILADHS